MSIVIQNKFAVIYHGVSIWTVGTMLITNEALLTLSLSTHCLMYLLEM
jgi:hypothetical protein